MTQSLFALAVLIGLASPAAAQVGADTARIEVLPGWRTETGSHVAAIRVSLAPGWKTYWRAPGDAGIPAQFDWSGSDNLAAVQVLWPVPMVFTQGGLTAVGYSDQVVIPLELTPLRAGQPIGLAGRIDMGVCEDICVPLSVRVEAELSADPARRDARIRAALADRPMTAAEAGAGAMRCAVEPGRDGLSVTATLRLPPLGGEEFAVIELPGNPAWVSQATTRRDGATLTARADVVAPGDQSASLDRSRLRVTVLGRNGAVDIQGCG